MTDNIDARTYPGATQSPDEDDASLGDSFERLVGSAKELAEAEVALVKLRGSVVAGAAKWIGLLVAVAFVIAFGMIVTLMIGAVMALAPHWGLGLSVLAVTGIALVLILLCGLAIRGQVGRIKEAFL
ncbi:hypothetical protein BH10PSE13_BH10PSE13_01940 [soil metagenome]